MRASAISRHTVVLLCNVALGVVVSPARSAFAEEARPSDAVAGPELGMAETLYREGLRLIEAQRYEEAAQKLAESYRIDPGVGTLLALAVCHEGQGKLATAWLEFNDAMRAAQRDKRSDRVEFALTHLAQIEPKLSRLTVSVAQPAPPSLVVELDGVRVGPAALGVPLPIDPGRHVLAARAPAKQSYSMEIGIGSSAEQRSVMIPPLADLIPPAASAAPARDVGTAATGVNPRAPSKPGIPASVYVSGAVTLALFGGVVGTFAGYMSERHCDVAGDGCRAAERLKWLNVGLWAASAAGVGVTFYLYTRPRSFEASARSVRVSPWAAPSALGVSAYSSF